MYFIQGAAWLYETVCKRICKVVKPDAGGDILTNVAPALVEAPPSSPPLAK